MKRRNLVFIISFVLLSFILPFAIEGLCAIVEKNQVITTTYTQSDILGYISSVLAFLLAMIAIFIDISNNDIKLTLDYGIKPKGQDRFARINIVNDSNIDCEIENICLTNTGKRYVELFDDFVSPFELKAKSGEPILIKVSELIEKIDEIKEGKYKHFKIRICLTTGKDVDISDKKINKFIKILRKHSMA